MSISSISAATNAIPPLSSSASSSGAAASATVDYNQFLQLLVAELSNQDPTSPQIRHNI